MDKATSNRLKRTAQVSKLIELVKELGHERIELLFERARAHAIMEKNVASEMVSDRDILEYLEHSAVTELCGRRVAGVTLFCHGTEALRRSFSFPSSMI